MKAVKHSAKRTSLLLGQDDLLKNPPIPTFREVRIDGGGTARACNTVYHIDQERITELLSFKSNQSLSAKVEGDNVIMIQISAEMVVVLSVVNWRWILMCYGMCPLPADKLFGPRQEVSLCLPCKSATCIHSYGHTIPYMVDRVLTPLLQRHGRASITWLIDPLLASKRRAEQILDILQSYGNHIGSSVQRATEWKGRGLFLPQIQRRVHTNERIQMILPSFPWKSVGTALSNDYSGLC